MQYVKLNNGVEMPILGYGVYQVSPNECERCVSDAIGVGYRSIDTAQAYGNEAEVGRAIKKSGVSRNELFVTTKIWISNAGETKAAASIDESLRRLGMDYVDLLLIHQPFGDYYGTYRAMEKALRDGKARAIGVSNFYPDRLIDIAEFNEIKPAINQVETHVFNQQREAQDVMRRYGTQIMSWGPFAEGRNGMFTNDVLVELCRVMKKINIYIFCSKEQIPQMLDFFLPKKVNWQIILWHKTNPIPTCGNSYMPDTEYCLFFREKGVFVGGSPKTKATYYVTPTNKEDKQKYRHPTPKPLQIIKNLIINSSKEGDLVLDPYVGSGTTAVAAKELNRHYIGIDKEEKYCNTAKERLEIEQLNLLKP